MNQLKVVFVFHRLHLASVWEKGIFGTQWVTT